ncbi:DUF4050 family protein [Quillaja saponaria]|uniref:DUF4050 family protein n=1 Tax=Quillaja saponaria TaxID=32244 RepID=A0AAD7PTE3_QUISA|nr:DUF4050 family protein [Quillaja saponaria]
MQFLRYVPPWILKILTCMGGCLGCFTTPVTISVDDQSKGKKVRGQTVKKYDISEDFWSSSTFEMDNSAILSQRSISSNQISDPQSSAGNQSNLPEFVNHGLLLWNQTRQQWVGSRTIQSGMQVREPRISWNATYESLLGNNKRFAQPIPLAEMIDFLVDIWEQDGLYA